MTYKEKAKDFIKSYSDILPLACAIMIGLLQEQEEELESLRTKTEGSGDAKATFGSKRG